MLLPFDWEEGGEYIVGVIEEPLLLLRFFIDDWEKKSLKGKGEDGDGVGGVGDVGGGETVLVVVLSVVVSSCERGWDRSKGGGGETLLAVVLLVVSSCGKELGIKFRITNIGKAKDR